MIDMAERVRGLLEWVSTAERGERYVYHVGTNAHGEVCRKAMDLYEGGFVLLVRKRAEQRPMFYYIAHRTGKKHG